MRYLFYVMTGFLLIVFQTSVLPALPLSGNVYDLLIVFVIYLGLFCPLVEALSSVLVLGVVMDSLSGTPFGLYFSSYFWLFFGLRWLTRFFHAGNVLLLVFTIAMGVVFENLIFFLASSLFRSFGDLVGPALGTLTVQCLWAGFTGPVVFEFIKTGHRRWLAACKRLSERRGG